MPLDFRYHLASLAAVFGALLIGILLGVAMNEGPGLRSQIRALQHEFRRSEALRDIDRCTDEFNESTAGLLVRDRLAGRNIALVVGPTAPTPESIKGVRGILQEAGAVIPLEITLLPALQELTPLDVAELYQGVGINVTSAVDVTDILHRLASDIGYGWSALIPVLHQKQLIRIHGEMDVPVSAVIYLGGTAPATEKLTLKQIDVPFMRACDERQLRVAAVESLLGETSAIPVYKKHAPLTIDNIDRAAGRIALVLALSAEENGHYGYKSTADAVAPSVE